MTATALISVIIKAGHNNDEIHIFFNNYREDSIKNGERKTQISRNGVNFTKIKCSSDIGEFLVIVHQQKCFPSTTKFCGSKPLYLGISLQAWMVSAGCASVFPFKLGSSSLVLYLTHHN